MVRGTKTSVKKIDKAEERAKREWGDIYELLYTYEHGEKIMDEDHFEKADDLELLSDDGRFNVSRHVFLTLAPISGSELQGMLTEEDYACFAQKLTKKEEDQLNERFRYLGFLK